MAAAGAVFPHRHYVGRVKFAATTLEAAAREVTAHANLRSGGSHVHLLNAYSVSLAERDATYLSTLSSGALNLPDGKPLTWVSRLRRDPEPLRQIRGVRFFLECMQQGLEQDTAHFLLGSTPETLKLLESSLLAKFPNLNIVGTFSPPFRKLSEDELRQQDRQIADSGAAMVWVGLGTPKQDFESARIAESLPVTALAVGAAFDFVAGTIREAPRVVSFVGLEWLYRLCREPRRLWRRYIVGNPRFVLAVLRDLRTRKQSVE